MKPYSYKPIFQKTTLASGVRVVTESHPFTRAVSAGIFVEIGTRYENERRAGITHLVEHMVFKGTRRRSSFEIAKSLDAVGGDLNAYTSREYTCFHATSLKEHLSLGLDILMDMATGARLAASDFQKEREVVLQEIQMSKDNLEEYILDMFLEKAFAGQDLGIPILGSDRSLQAMRRRDLVEHYNAMFRGPRIIVSVAGPVEHDHVVELVERGLRKVATRGSVKKRRRPRIKKVMEYVERPSEQVHLLVGLPSCSYRSQHRFEAFVVNELLGGGVTSRLYQKIREDKGLVYSVYSYLQSFVDTGLLLMYAGTESPFEVLKIMRTELDRLRRSGLKHGELELYKTQVKGQILLGAEDMENRMNSLGVNEMVFGQYRPIDEVIRDIDKVTTKTLKEYIAKYVDSREASLMVMGDLPAVEALKLMEIWE